MRAMSLQAPRHLVRIDLPEPNPPAPGEALVRVHRVGICGADIGAYLGKQAFFSYRAYPAMNWASRSLGSEKASPTSGRAIAVLWNHTSTIP